MASSQIKLFCDFNANFLYIVTVFQSLFGNDVRMKNYPSAKIFKALANKTHFATFKELTSYIIEDKRNSEKTLRC